MPRQLVLDLPTRTARDRDAFFVSQANAEAVAAIDAPDDWPGGRLVLAGPRASGKTHLVHVWAAASGAEIIAAADLAARQPDGPNPASPPVVAVEDVDRIAARPEAEQALFHLYNYIGAAGGQLLISSAAPPATIRFGLPDLASRLQGCRLVRLAPPDDALLAAIMVKQFADRQVVVSPAVVEYLVTRMDRGFDAVDRLVDALDRAALAEGRAITRPLAAEVLARLGVEGG